MNVGPTNPIYYDAKLDTISVNPFLVLMLLETGLQILTDYKFLMTDVTGWDRLHYTLELIHQD